MQNKSIAAIAKKKVIQKLGQNFIFSKLKLHESKLFF